MSDKSIRAGLLVAAWTSIPGLVSDSEMVAFFKKKMGGGKGGKGKMGRVLATDHNVIEID